jgi:hypothetical protein
MTGIAAVQTLERLGWRPEAPALAPVRATEAEESAGPTGPLVSLDCRPRVGLGSKLEKGER